MTHTRRVLAAAWLAGTLGVGAAGGLAVAGGEAASPGAAEAAFRQYCRLCHRVPGAVSPGRAYRGWRDTVARMSVHREHLGRAAIPVSSQLLIARRLAEGLAVSR